MDYLQIVDLVFSVLTSVLGLLVLHFVLFAVLGLFTKKKFPHTDEKLKYGIIIPARNEEAVVGNLIQSVYKNKYPQDKLQVFVIAHNCTDNTAQIARDMGATVYEYNNPAECTMGYAFKYLFSQIERDFGTQNYDGFFLFNADNILADDYFDKMNDAFVAEDRQKVITSFRNCKNFGSNVISAMYGIYFIQGCRLESRGRTVIGCSTRVQGTGYVIPADVVKDGWQYVTLTEDWEFSADQLINNRKIIYCDEAVFYDEQPTSVRIMLRQRLRWSRGHLLVCLTRYGHLLKSFFTPKRKGGGKYKFSLYDFSVNVMPICVTSVVLALCRLVCLAIAPVWGFDAASLWTNWAISTAQGVAYSYALNLFAGLLIVILERKRLKNVRISVLIGALLLWPVFLVLAIPLEVICLFVNVGWKQIPHDDPTTFEQVNKADDADQTNDEPCDDQTDDAEPTLDEDKQLDQTVDTEQTDDTDETDTER